MDANRGVQVRVRVAHDRGGRSAGLEAGDIDASLVDRIMLRDLAGDARDQRGLALVALLVAHAEPVPAFRHVGGARLRRIDDEAIMLFSGRVHPRTGGEVIGRLGATVQHDNQGHGLPFVGLGT